MKKKIILTIIANFLFGFGLLHQIFAAERIFYESFETTNSKTHFLESNFGTNYESYWNEFLNRAHQSSISYAGNYALNWDPPVDSTLRSNFGMGTVNFGNENNINFDNYEARYWYIKWYQRWESSTYSGQNKIIYIGCGGDYYYVAKSSNGTSLQYVIRDDFAGNILKIGYPSHSSNLDDDKWHKIELFIDFGSSNTASDGDTWFKIDGETLYTVTDLNFVTLPTPLSCITLPGNVGMAEEKSGSQNVYIDELEVYTLNGPDDIPLDNGTPSTPPSAPPSAPQDFNN